jgi:RNA polymerase sigma-70 factor (ECF subfamily)
MPDHPEALGLLALLLLIDSRRAARVNSSRELVLLADQDRSLWNRERMEEGRELVRRCLRINQPGPYQIQAAINAVHSDAASAEQVDWPQILKLYDHLLTLDPTPIVALNRAVVVAEIKGPEIALRLVDELSLRDYYLFHAIRADLLRRLDRREAAVHAYDAAIERCSNANERKFLQRRRTDVLDRS